ncbi:Cof-type HAD-IIB family hydrolase [uncultured Vagococcus sp.]|uniref:Cof-type HAD-IIB family hydrolase n=1 Tax=uncultured Vagococcus sp. TaxID=189676 RepID=UPI0028D4F326|nr:Cof-type HAD-IIB family hydrolase [uncultured Vagococcus sp.]
MKISAVFFDIDGTLVTHQAKALASTKESIAQLKSQGIICGLATGRGPVRLDEQVDQLALDVFVTYNGQYVYTRDQVLYANAFPVDLVTKIAAYCDQNKRQILFGSNDELAGSSIMSIGQKAWAKRLQRFLPKARNSLFFKKIAQKISRTGNKQRYQDLAILRKPIYQCVLISPESEQPILEKLFPECKFTRSNPYTVDIIMKRNSKSVGIQKVGQHLGFTLDQCMAFGDSWNDTEMLQSVGLGVAMGNANEDIKLLADYVTTSNTEDGIYNALRHYNIIK